MYKHAKSCVMVNNDVSDLFDVNLGVRQGENLSPVLFSLFLNDMSTYLLKKMPNLKTIQEQLEICNMQDKDINVFINFFILLYADDTVIFAENAEDLQKGLSGIEEYCLKWNLKLNANKCKVIIFSRGLIRKYPDFSIGNVVRDFTYLGIKLNYNNCFNVAQKDLYDRGFREMFAPIKKGKNLNLPVDIMIDLFDSMVSPVLLCGAEVWGFQNIYLIEKLQIQFYKIILNLRSSTPTQMVLGEVGKFPTLICIKTRILMYWFNLINPDNRNKLSSIIYQLMFLRHKNNMHENMYITFIKNTLIEVGLPGAWENQSTTDMTKSFF